jgi:hypothetical protein
MIATASEPEDKPVADRSVGYMRSDGTGWQPNTDTLPYRGTSAGGGYSTVEDLMKFGTALQTNYSNRSTPKCSQPGKSRQRLAIGMPMDSRKLLLTGLTARDASVMAAARRG